MLSLLDPGSWQVVAISNACRETENEPTRFRVILPGRCGGKKKPKISWRRGICLMASQARKDTHPPILAVFICGKIARSFTQRSENGQVA